jgi:hypothetical protein
MARPYSLRPCISSRTSKMLLLADFLIFDQQYLQNFGEKLIDEKISAMILCSKVRTFIDVVVAAHTNDPVSKDP